VPRISVVIVNWNTRDYLRTCLCSLVGAVPSAALRTGREPPLQEIIVVDNASGDGSALMAANEFPRVRLIRNQRNIGYAAANNQGIRASKGDYIMLLNPDAWVQKGCLQSLARFLDGNPRAAAAAARLLNPDGSLQQSVRSFPAPLPLIFDALGLARLFPRSRVLAAYRMTWWDHSEVRQVDQPMASALMLRRKALDEVGLFDERFPLYFNDVDLCLRLKRAGWKIFYLPHAVCVHHVAASTAQVRCAAIAESHRSLLRFYRKHYRAIPLPIYVFCALVITVSGWIRVIRCGIHEKASDRN
jgi:hypothetical protein